MELLNNIICSIYIEFQRNGNWVTRLHFKFEEDGLDISLFKDLNKTLNMIIYHFEAKNGIMGDKPHISHVKF